MSDCTEEIFHQEAGLVCRKTIEIHKLQAQLEKAEEVIEFYGDTNNYNHSKEYKLADTWCELKDDWDYGSEEIEYNTNRTPLVFGGKKAREYFRDKELEK